MLITKTSPQGIDVRIQKFQTLLHARLMTAWNLNPGDVDENKLYACYGRAYRNRKDNGYIAEVYTGNDQYKDVYWDSSKNAISFFGTGTNIKQGVNTEADVHLVFFVNIKKLKPSITHRGDEEVRQDVIEVASKNNYGFTYLSCDTGIENVLREYPGVLREYPGVLRDERLKNVDMHPVHCFRLNFSLAYNNKINC